MAAAHGLHSLSSQLGAIFLAEARCRLSGGKGRKKAFPRLLPLLIHFKRHDNRHRRAVPLDNKLVPVLENILQHPAQPAPHINGADPLLHCPLPR